VLSVKSVNVCFVLQFETPETVDFSNNDNWEVPNSSLQCTRIREIGHGQFGEVWQEGLLGNITPVAIKTLKPGILNIDFFVLISSEIPHGRLNVFFISSDKIYFCEKMYWIDLYL